MTQSPIPETIRRTPSEAEAQEFLRLNQDELAELVTFVDFAEGFTLGLVEVNFIRDAYATSIPPPRPNPPHRHRQTPQHHPEALKIRFTEAQP